MKRPVYQLVVLMMSLIVIVTPSNADAVMTIDKVLDITPFTARDWEIIKNGGAAEATIASASTREIAVGVACLLDENQTDPLDPIREPRPMLPKQFITAYGVLPESVDPNAFNTLTLGDYAREEARKYRDFKGGFGLNLSRQEIDLFHSEQPRSEGETHRFYNLLQQQLLSRLSAYRKDGLAGMASYDRGSREAAAPAEELRRTLDTAKPLQLFFPELYQIWTNYPNVSQPNTREHFIWANVNLDNRPAIILSHRIELDLGERQIIAERFVYSSRFINTGYALSAVVPVEEGRLFFYIYRVWIDRWSGLARLKQSAGQKLMIRQMEGHLDHLGVCRSR